MSESPVNILCMRWGDKYGPEYVVQLYGMVAKNLQRPFRFVCLSDRKLDLPAPIETLPIPDLGIEGRRGKTTWQKLGVFSPTLGDLTGPALFLDLDLIVCGPLDKFFDYEPEKIGIIHNWISPWKTLFRPRPEIGNSSVFRFPVNECGHLIEEFQAEKEQAVETWWPPQTYLTERIRPQLTYWPEEWVKSFKFHCRQPFPLNYLLDPKKPSDLGEPSIIAFHGRPNPDQALEGYRGKKIHHFTKPAKWIAEYWK
ncbi:hypothetical protein [Roseibacillus ishigakijimensis]|uniref:Glycosyltransferase n=1 Tax=Roseibacillus ishigakijimensis TaxID=454146 RepID=A0A934VH84_9BACT|nr:hypothetical protein [Roseibacillus ishigakijimensis]MBK1833673.1 hypothetical protein [Roseibacillus ishigakijimensis]